MKVLNFQEYISEGLWSTGINRSTTNKKRLENSGMFDDICKEVGEMMAKKMKIEYKPELCQCVNYDDPDNVDGYQIDMDFSEIDLGFSEVSFIVDPLAGKDNESAFTMALDEFVSYEYFDYKDYKSTTITKPVFNKVKRILDYITTKLAEKYDI